MLRYSNELTEAEELRDNSLWIWSTIYIKENSAASNFKFNIYVTELILGHVLISFQITEVKVSAGSQDTSKADYSLSLYTDKWEIQKVLLRTEEMSRVLWTRVNLLTDWLLKATSGSWKQLQTCYFFSFQMTAQLDEQQHCISWSPVMVRQMVTPWRMCMCVCVCLVQMATPQTTSSSTGKEAIQL